VPGPSYHGRTHSAGGTDPIPGMLTTAIRFELANVGGWLNVHTTSDVAGVGMQFTLDSGAFKVNAESFVLDLTSGLSVTSDTGSVVTDNDFSIVAGRNVVVSAAADAAISAVGTLGLTGAQINIGVGVAASITVTFNTSQRVVCTTLGDVIALLQSYGLAS
jgi:hypothetical protein